MLIEEPTYYKFVYIKDIKTATVSESEGGVFIKNEQSKGNKLIFINQITFTLFGKVIVIVGGSFYSFFAIIKAIVDIYHTYGWENGILMSVFGTTDLETKTIELFRERISYWGLYRLYEKFNELKNQIKSKFEFYNKMTNKLEIENIKL